MRYDATQAASKGGTPRAQVPARNRKARRRSPFRKRGGTRQIEGKALPVGDERAVIFERHDNAVLLRKRLGGLCGGGKYLPTLRPVRRENSLGCGVRMTRQDLCFKTSTPYFARVLSPSASMTRVPV